MTLERRKDQTAQATSEASDARERSGEPEHERQPAIRLAPSRDRDDDREQLRGMSDGDLLNRYEF